MAPNTGNWVTTTSINCTRNVRATGWSEDWNGWDSRVPWPREPNDPFACRNPQPLSGNEVDPVNAANAQFLANTLPENQEFSKDRMRAVPVSPMGATARRLKRFCLAAPAGPSRSTRLGRHQYL